MLVLIDVGDAGPIELPPGRRSHAKAVGLVNENQTEYIIQGQPMILPRFSATHLKVVVRTMTSDCNPAPLSRIKAGVDVG